MSMRRTAAALSLFVLSTLAGIVSVYFLLFSIWMTAHPRYDSEAWHVRVYERFGITALDGLIWLGSVIWLWRIVTKRQSSV
jgi:hypothetical protein